MASEMSDVQKKDGVDALDSWESLLEDDDEEFSLEKVNKLLAQIQISTPAGPSKIVDPFEDGGSSKHKPDQSEDDDRFNDFRHLVILSGASVDTEDVLARLRKDFGQTVRMKPIDSTNHVITLANMLDARHAVKNAHKFAPLRLHPADDPTYASPFLNFLDKHRDELRPTKMVRPATNVSVIRSVVGRHLNVNVPVSSQQRDLEKEQLQRAREAKQAKKAIWN